MVKRHLFVRRRRGGRGSDPKCLFDIFKNVNNTLTLIKHHGWVESSALQKNHRDLISRRLLIETDNKFEFFSIHLGRVRAWKRPRAAF